MMASGKIAIDLLPEERAVLLEWTYPFADLQSQLKSFGSSEGIAAVTISPYFLELLIGDLKHAIVDRACRDAAVIELCDRLEYVEQTGDGALFYLR
jgi:hypothetical protein